MSGPPGYSGNPFVPQAPTGFIPAPDPGGLLSGVRQNDPFPQGILLSPKEHMALATAPQRPPGTEVTVQAKPVIFPFDPLQHMFETYDDGQKQYIYRGGPDGMLSVHAQVDPAAQSPDYGAGKRVLFRTFLPGTTADQAVAPARAEAARINASGSPYGGIVSNSNTVIGGSTQRQYGKAVGDWRTPGYKSGFAPPLAPFSPMWP